MFGTRLRAIVALLVQLVFLSGICSAAASNHEEAYRLIKRRDIAGLKALSSRDPYVVNSRNQYGLPLLHRAAMTDCVECVKLLLDSAADIKATDKNHARTALHVAAGWSTLEMVQLLVSRGADINALTSAGATPLTFVRDNFYNDSYDERGKITTFLLKRGAK